MYISVNFHVGQRDLNIYVILHYNSKCMALHNNEIPIMGHFTVPISYSF